MKDLNFELSRIFTVSVTGMRSRYMKLTGWFPPAAGGLKYSELTDTQQKIERDVRLKISRELRHNRVEITRVYLD